MQTSTNFPCEMAIKVLELKRWKEDARDKASTAKSPTKMRDTGQDKREPRQHVLFCYLFSHMLVSDV